MSKHTEGPWEFHRFGDTDDGRGICDVRTTVGCFVVAESMYEEDARLIAAAPYLLQAAEQFLASVKDGNVSELVEYYADIFGEAVKKAGGHLPE